jgi:hypothetical protein
MSERLIPEAAEESLIKGDNVSCSAKSSYKVTLKNVMEFSHLYDFFFYRCPKIKEKSGESIFLCLSLNITQRL